MKYALLFGLTLLVGCAVSHKQVVVKSTVFGFQVGASPSGGPIPVIQFGLVRNEYLSNPTSTNQLDSAPLDSYVDAEMSAGRQGGLEVIKLGGSR